MTLKTKILLIAAALFLIMGYASVQIIPPFSSPDENSHLMRAEMLSRGQFSLSPAPEGIPSSLGGSGGWVDKNFLRFTLQSLQWIFASDVLSVALLRDEGLIMPQNLSDLRNMGSRLHWSDELAFVPASGTGYYNPIIYSPHIAALWLARQLNLSLASSHDLARITVLGTGLILCALGLSWFPLPPLALAMLATPMAIFQWCSPTVDGLTLGLTVCAVALFLSQLSPSSKPSTKCLFLLSLLIFLIVTTRIHMLPLLAMPIFLAKRQATRGGWVAAIAVIFFSAAWITFAIFTTVDTRIDRTHSTSEIAWIYLSHPSYFPTLLWRTIDNEALRIFYLHSYMGNLGWLDTPLSNTQIIWLYLGLIFFLIASLLPLKKIDIKEEFSSRLLLLAASLASGFLVFWALAITWNDHPAQTIEGIQGRYFILPLFIAACALWKPRRAELSPRNNPSGRILTWTALSLGVYFIYSFSSAFLALSLRF